MDEPVAEFGSWTLQVSHAHTCPPYHNSKKAAHSNHTQRCPRLRSTPPFAAEQYGSSAQQHHTQHWPLALPDNRSSLLALPPQPHLQKYPTKGQAAWLVSMALSPRIDRCRCKPKPINYKSQRVSPAILLMSPGSPMLLQGDDCAGSGQRTELPVWLLVYYVMQSNVLNMICHDMSVIK